MKATDPVLPFNHQNHGILSFIDNIDIGVSITTTLSAWTRTSSIPFPKNMVTGNWDSWLPSMHAYSHSFRLLTFTCWKSPEIVDPATTASIVKGEDFKPYLSWVVGCLIHLRRWQATSRVAGLLRFLPWRRTWDWLRKNTAFFVVLNSSCFHILQDPRCGLAIV